MGMEGHFGDTCLSTCAAGVEGQLCLQGNWEEEGMMVQRGTLGGEMGPMSP